MTTDVDTFRVTFDALIEVRSPGRHSSLSLSADLACQTVSRAHLPDSGTFIILQLPGQP